MTFRSALVLAALFVAGCSPFHSGSLKAGQAEGQVVLGVPFRAQEISRDCGPAALASLLAYRGDQVPVEKIRKEVYIPSLGGTLLPDLENYARRRGFSTRSGRGDLELLRHALDVGRPVLIPVQTGIFNVSRPHYLVVYGYDEERFLVHAGTREAVFIEEGELLERWKKMNRLFLYLD